MLDEIKFVLCDIMIPTGLKIMLHKLLVLLTFKEILNKQSSYALIKTIAYL